MPILEQAKNILNIYRDTLLSYPAVQSVSVSILNGEPIILVLLTRRLTAGEYLPNYLEGIRVVPRITGVIQPMVLNHTAKYRPVLGGISIGCEDVGAGTLGAILYLNGEPYIGSNLHVLSTYERAKKGIPVLQPGVIDGGNTEDVIGYLDWWQPVGHENKIDFALAKPLDPSLVEKRILGVDGFETFPAEAEIGEEVVKSGRSSGVTQGRVASTDASCKIAGTRYTFRDLLLVEGEEPLCLPGDSGSAVLHNHELVGFLFAGPTEAPHDYYLACKATNVEKALLGEEVEREWIIPLMTGVLGVLNVVFGYLSLMELRKRERR